MIRIIDWGGGGSENYSVPENSELSHLELLPRSAIAGKLLSLVVLSSFSVVLAVI